MDVGMSVWLPGTELATLHGIRPQTSMTDSDLAVGGVRYERVEPMRVWRLTCDADATVRDLERKRETRTDAAAARSDVPCPHARRRQRRPGAERHRRQRRDTQHRRQGTPRAGWTCGRDGSRPTASATSCARAAATATSRGGRGAGADRACGAGSRSTSATICTSAASGSAPRRATCTAVGCGATARRRASATGPSAPSSRRDGITHRVTTCAPPTSGGARTSCDGELLRVAPVAHQVRGPAARSSTKASRAGPTSGKTGYGIAEYLHQLDEHGRPLVPIE